jgi:tetratricopeptide (TPR) repeat protein
MGKVIKLGNDTHIKFGPQKASKKKKVDPEDYGQLNLFNPIQAEARVISIHGVLTPFEEALKADETGNPKVKHLYMQAIAKGDCVPDAYCNLGIIECQTGNKATAVDFLTKCLEHNPRHFEAHYNLANIFSEEGNLKLAKFHYQVSIELQPDFGHSFYNLGILLAMEGAFREAIGKLEIFQRLEPTHDKEKVNRLLTQLRKSAFNKVNTSI